MGAGAEVSMEGNLIEVLLNLRKALGFEGMELQERARAERLEERQRTRKEREAVRQEKTP